MSAPAKTFSLPVIRNQRSVLRAALGLALALAQVAPVALAAPIGGGAPTVPAACADDGWCFLPRWEPELLAPGHRFGVSVAIDGNYAAVSSPGAGAVLVYRLAQGHWSSHQLILSPTWPGGEFGASLDLDGFKLVIGDPGDDTLGPDAGAAFVYELQGIEFGLVSALGSEQPEPGGEFGRSVAVSGTWLAVGEPGATPGGRVTTYSRNPAGWVLDEFREEPFTDRLGEALDLWGTDLAVGDPSFDAPGQNAGAVYLYRLSATNSYDSRQVTPWNTLPGNRFGAAVAIDGDRLVVGAPDANQFEKANGRAYVFVKELLGVEPFFDYDELQELVPCQMVPNAHFGTSVDIDGSRIVVGSPNHQVGSAVMGVATTYRRQVLIGESWNVESQVRDTNGTLSDHFASSVGVSGSMLLAGAPDAPFTGPGGGLKAGAAYLVSTSPDALGGGECPCDALGTVKPYGQGKAGALGVPELSLSEPLVPGQSSLLRLQHAQPGAPPLLLLGQKLGTIPFDGGTIHLGSSIQVLAMPPVGPFGAVGILLDVPDVPALCGASLVFQTVNPDPVAGGTFGFAYSNGLIAYVGY